MIFKEDCKENSRKQIEKKKKDHLGEDWTSADGRVERDEIFSRVSIW